MNIVALVISAVVSLGAGLGIGWLIFNRIESQKLALQRKEAADLVAQAQNKAKDIQKEADIKSKEELIRRREEAEREIRNKQKDIRTIEKRVQSREQSLDKKAEQLDQKEEQIERQLQGLADREKRIEGEEQKVQQSLGEMQERLEKVASLSAAEAKDLLMESMVEDARKASAKMIREIEERTREEANGKARRILANAIQRYAGEHVADTTVTTVNIPDDQMKGRIIGREGRNIRAIEAATGCDLIIDDTPQAILLSGHNPIRRAVAKIAVEKLVHDGRIHPGRIESVVKSAEKEVQGTMREAGEQATLEAGVHGINKELVRLLGGLKFKQIDTHNILQHCIEVSAMAGMIAAELGLDEKNARRAGLLHDIGKSSEHDIPGTHPEIGAELLKRHGEPREVIEAVKGHHDDSPTNLLAVILQAADSLSNARPGARREQMGAYIKRLQDLEEMATQYPGATHAFAIQAGRELHVAVDHKLVNDDEAVVMARELAQRIENEMNYPGQVHVTVIRESRSVQYAK